MTSMKIFLTSLALLLAYTSFSSAVCTVGLVNNAETTTSTTGSVTSTSNITNVVDLSRNKRSLSDMATTYLMNAAKTKLGMNRNSDKKGLKENGGSGHGGKSAIVGQLLDLWKTSQKSNTGSTGSSGSGGNGGILQSIAKKVMSG